MKSRQHKKKSHEIENLETYTEGVLKRKEVEISALKKVLEFLEHDQEQLRKRIIQERLK